MGGSPGTTPSRHSFVMAEPRDSPIVIPPEPEPFDGPHGAQEEDESASEEDEHVSDIGCPCASPELFLSITAATKRS